MFFKTFGLREARRRFESTQLTAGPKEATTTIQRRSENVKAWKHHAKKINRSG